MHPFNKKIYRTANSRQHHGIYEQCDLEVRLSVKRGLDVKIALDRTAKLDAPKDFRHLKTYSKSILKQVARAIAKP